MAPVPEEPRHREPLEFRLGARQVIKGWDQGVVGMKVGGKQIPAVNAKRLSALFLARADANKDGKIGGDESAAAKAEVQGPR